MIIKMAKKWGLLKSDVMPVAMLRTINRTTEEFFKLLENNALLQK